MGGKFEANSLKSDFHQLVQCRAAASVRKRRRRRGGCIGFGRLDQGPLQVTAGPLPAPPSTHIHTQRGCDKTLSFTVDLSASGGRAECIWRRGYHLDHITFKMQRPALLFLHLSPPEPDIKPWPQEHIVHQWAGGCWNNRCKIWNNSSQAWSWTVTILSNRRFLSRTQKKICFDLSRWQMWVCVHYKI